MVPITVVATLVIARGAAVCFASHATRGIALNFLVHATCLPMGARWLLDAAMQGLDAAIYMSDAAMRGLDGAL